MRKIIQQQIVKGGYKISIDSPLERKREKQEFALVLHFSLLKGGDAFSSYAPNYAEAINFMKKKSVVSVETCFIF